MTLSFAGKYILGEKNPLRGLGPLRVLPGTFSLKGLGPLGNGQWMIGAGGLRRWMRAVKPWLLQVVCLAPKRQTWMDIELEKSIVDKTLMPESKPWMNERRRMSDEMIGLDGLDRGVDMGCGDGTSRPTMRPHPGLSPGKPCFLVGYLWVRCFLLGTWQAALR